MTVGAQIPRHTVDIGREIRSVVQIEAAQEVLVGLAAPRMLCRDHAGNDFEQLRDFEHWPNEQIRAADGALTRRVGRSEQLEPATEYDDFLHRPRWPSRCLSDG